VVEEEAEEAEEAEEVEEVLEEVEEVLVEAAEVLVEAVEVLVEAVEVLVEVVEEVEEAVEVGEEAVVEEEELKIYSIYKMTRIVLLRGDHIIEGIIGMVSLIMVAYIINHTISAPRSVILGMAFIISWYFRRIGVNIYLYLHKHHNVSIAPITYNTIR
jgi:hypothetical protein